LFVAQTQKHQNGRQAENIPNVDPNLYPFEQVIQANASLVMPVNGRRTPLVYKWLAKFLTWQPMTVTYIWYPCCFLLCPLC